MIASRVATTIDNGWRRFVPVALAMLLVGCMPPSWGANALLHPGRRAATRRPSQPYDDVKLAGDGVTLATWVFHTAAPRRGTVVYLHGLSDNRGSSVWLAQHLTERGFDVVAYDSRAHGESGGDACTYGFHEKRDLRHVLDGIAAGPVVLLGFSMGAAVALQAAAGEARVAAVVAIATISDLRTASRERAPFFASRHQIDEAVRIAEEQGRFRADEVSPVSAAAHVSCPVLVIHGADDDETPPAHSRRVFAALAGPKDLLVVPHAGHSNVLTADTWRHIDAWLDTQLPRSP
jgi:alpha-beta hydrolase superfamily lysophospholipase